VRRIRPENVNPERWRQIQEFYKSALKRVESERSRFLDEVCAGDSELRQEVESLLAHEPSAGEMLEPDRQQAGEVKRAEASAQSDSPTRIAPHSEQTAQPSMEGRRIGPYQVLRILGEGGMGSVYAASRADKEYRKVVAIKLVRSELVNEEMLQRFRNERQVLADLDHPSIARLLDGGTTEDGLPYLVMEFVDGPRIDRYCESQHLPLLDRLKLFQKVCEAIQYAHQHLVIHRDIKPGNILVTNTQEPKLLDFGIASLISTQFSGEDLVLSKGEAHPMTLRYASPEQLRRERISTSSDLYSLGVLLYELLTGRHPFERALTGGAEAEKAALPQGPLTEWLRRAEIENAILTEEPQRPSLTILEHSDAKTNEKAPPEPTAKLSRQLRGDLDCIVMMTLSKPPNERYPSVQSLSDDISKYLNGDPIGARKGDYRYKVGKFVRKHATGVVAASLVAIALVSATAVSMQFAHTARIARGRADDRFNDVRKLARFVIYDFDNAIRSGVTPARKLVTSEALGYLNRLAQDTGGDLALEKEIVDGYLKVGDLQGNPFVANLGDFSGAKQSYARALELAHAIRTKHPDDPQVRTLTARVDVRLAGLGTRTDPVSALKRFQETQSSLELLASGDGEAKRSLMHVLVNIGALQVGVGDTSAGLAAFTRAHEIAQDLFTASHNDLEARDAMATADANSGEALAARGSKSDALVRLQRALSIYEELASISAQSPARRRVLAVLNEIGDVLTDTGKKQEAVESYSRALKLNQTLMAEDPKNVQYRQDLGITLQRLAEVLVAAHRMSEARQMTDRALKLLRPIVDGPGMSFDETHQICWILLTTPFKELQDPAVAKQYAEKLVSSTQAKDPAILDLLARSYFGTGDSARAVETETKAISLLPPNTQSEMRKELESNLKKFRARTKKRIETL
jgi:serine/threonine protein kinase/tetratricopeptide (TPR) repeat protein